MSMAWDTSQVVAGARPRDKYRTLNQIVADQFGGAEPCGPFVITSVSEPPAGPAIWA